VLGLGRIILLAAVAAAAAPPDQIVLSGTVTVPRGEEVGEVVVLHGSAAIGGVADGDVVVLDGPIAVTGQVSGSVVAVNGSVTLGRDAQVRGDVMARDRIQAADGARVDGRIRPHVAFAWRGPVAVLGRFAAWLAVAVSTLVLGAILALIAPRGVEAVARAMLGSPLRALGLGIGVIVGAPLLALLGIVSLIVMPFGLVLLLGLALVLFSGVALAELALGRRMWREPRSRWLALLIGWAIVSAISAMPFVGPAAWLVASVLGLGSATIAIWRARGGAGRHRGKRTALTPAPEPGIGL
jgi:hypothetical protein